MKYLKFLLISLYIISGVYCSQAQNTTTNPLDKFAFLLSGSTEQRFVEDIKLVFDMLTQYYNYPKDQIWIVFGDTITNTTYFDVPAANKLILDATTTISDLNTLFAALKTEADLSSDNTLLLYFTGEGTNIPTLTLNGIGSSIDTNWYTDNVNDFTNSPIMNAELNVVMQQSYSGYFDIIVSSSLTALWSFTSACSSGQTAVAGELGNKFTEAWTAGFKLEASNGGTNSGTFADQASPVSSLNYLISLEQAKTFAADWMNDPAQTPQFGDAGDLYLGKPALLIRDGDHETHTNQDHESPDIYLTHPNHSEITDEDIYIRDTTDTYHNTLNVRVLNIGTHPIRKIYAGVTRYDSEIGGLSENRVKEIILTDEVLCPIPMTDDETQPEDDLPRLFSYISQFEDIRFPETTHQYIRAKAGLEEFTPAELEAWTWDYSNLNNEAQRNIELFGTTDIINISENDEFRVHYSNGTITLYPVKDIKSGQAEIYNSSGKLVYSTHLNVSGKSEINFSESSGYYILKIITNKKYISKKFIVN